VCIQYSSDQSVLLSRCKNGSNEEFVFNTTEGFVFSTSAGADDSDEAVGASGASEVSEASGSLCSTTITHPPQTKCLTGQNEAPSGDSGNGPSILSICLTSYLYALPTP
jgi:hypothetical protein